MIIDHARAEYLNIPKLNNLYYLGERSFQIFLVTILFYCTFDGHIKLLDSLLNEASCYKFFRPEQFDELMRMCKKLAEELDLQNFLEKFTNSLFLNFLAKESSHFFPSVDEDGNTALHFLVRYLSVLEIANVFKQFSLQELKELRNDKGETLYNLIIEMDLALQFASRINDSFELQMYLNDYRLVHHIRFETLVAANFLQKFLNVWTEVSDVIIQFCTSTTFTFNESHKSFLRHPRVLNAELNGQRILDQYFFYLCSSTDNLDFLQELGIDARNLIGTSVRPKHPIYPIPFSVIKKLESFGWTIWDLKVLAVFNSLKNSFRFSTVFKEKAVTTEFKSINLDHVFGEKESCIICMDAYSENSEVIFLECFHIFTKIAFKNICIRKVAALYARKTPII